LGDEIAWGPYADNNNGPIHQAISLHGQHGPCNMGNYTSPDVKHAEHEGNVQNLYVSDWRAMRTC